MIKYNQFHRKIIFHPYECRNLALSTQIMVNPIGIYHISSTSLIIILRMIL